MTFNSKRSITGMVEGVAAVTAYIIYICMGTAPPTEDVAAWARHMLVFIGIGGAGQIVMQILFHIVFSISIAVK